jgi:hypothetical protein
VVYDQLLPENMPEELIKNTRKISWDSWTPSRNQAKIFQTHQCCIILLVEMWKKTITGLAMKSLLRQSADGRDSLQDIRN